jgi:hypothetical protein
MSTPNSSTESPIDKAIAEVLERLHVLEPEDKEYAAATNQLEKLHRMKMAEHTASVDWIIKNHEIAQAARPKPVSRDTLVLAAANLLGIVLIVGHERANVITSKAVGFIKTLR